MERIRTSERVGHRCPVCDAVKWHDSEKPKSGPPKCGACGRLTKPQGEFFVCPHCTTFWDDVCETTMASASDDPVRSANHAEANRSHHRGKYRRA